MVINIKDTVTNCHLMKFGRHIVVLLHLSLLIQQMASKVRLSEGQLHPSLSVEK